MLNDILKCGYVIKKREYPVFELEKKELVYDTFIGGEIEKKDQLIYDIKTNKIITEDIELLKNNIKKCKNKGFVYLIELEKMYKIGQTKNLIQRMRFFENTYHKYPKLINYIVSNDYKMIEKKFHERYKNFRLKNEWFNLDENFLKDFDKIKTIYY